MTTGEERDVEEWPDCPECGVPGIRGDLLTGEVGDLLTGAGEDVDTGAVAPLVVTAAPLTDDDVDRAGDDLIVDGEMLVDDEFCVLVELPPLDLRSATLGDWLEGVVG